MKTTERTITSYQAVVLQSRAHRVIKAQLTRALRDHGLTMMQWSIIGLINDAGANGMRISDLARELDTSLAFITTSVNVLEAKRFVNRVGHLQDNRAKLVRLSEDFAPKVKVIEASVSKKQREEIYDHIEAADADVYFRVLSQIAKIV